MLGPLRQKVRIDPLGKPSVDDELARARRLIDVQSFSVPYM